MNYFYHIAHIEIMGEKDLGHIVKASDDTFAYSEIIPVPGIIYVFLVLYLLFKTSVNYCGKKHINYNYHLLIFLLLYLMMQNYRAFQR